MIVVGGKCIGNKKNCYKNADYFCINYNSYIVKICT